MPQAAQVRDFLQGHSQAYTFPSEESVRRPEGQSGCFYPGLTSARYTRSKLNAELLEGRTPVVVMEARPLKLRQFQVLSKHYFGRVGWHECYGKLGHCMARESLLVVCSSYDPRDTTSAARPCPTSSFPR